MRARSHWIRDAISSSNNLVLVQHTVASWTTFLGMVEGSYRCIDSQYTRAHIFFCRVGLLAIYYWLSDATRNTLKRGRVRVKLGVVGVAVVVLMTRKGRKQPASSSGRHVIVQQLLQQRITQYL